MALVPKITLGRSSRFSPRSKNKIFTIHETSDECLGMKLAWMLDGVRYNLWKAHFKWLLLGLRMVLRFPYSSKPNGEVEVTFFSLSSIYWILAYSLLSGTTIKNLLFLVYKFTSEDVDTMEGVIIFYKITIMAYVLLKPLSWVREFHSFASFINKCPDYLLAFEKGLGTPVRLHYRKQVIICQIILFLLIAVLVIVCDDVLYWADNYSRVAICVEGWSIGLVVLYWVFSTYEMAKIGDVFRDKIRSDLCSHEGQVTASKVKEMRIAWLELSRMIRHNADAVSLMLTLLLSWSLTCIFIMSCFVSINMLVSGTTKYLGMIAVMASSVSLTVSLYECGHRLSRDAGVHVGRSLAKVNLLKMDPQAVDEVKLFLKNVAMNYPLVRIAGVITINRFSITSVISVSVTYLIVLVQWQVDDSAEANQNANNSFADALVLTSDHIT